ncbi:hypothetical protein V6N12_075270 [Hibiscus sabdariffa]|uniref:Uncharacterized protein n=1 Tax=Hibiscus sabdariffa TaxID=183260 RepID=A0ABR2C731_9ROSI
MPEGEAPHTTTAPLQGIAFFSTVTDLWDNSQTYLYSFNMMNLEKETKAAIPFVTVHTHTRTGTGTGTLAKAKAKAKDFVWITYECNLEAFEEKQQTGNPGFLVTDKFVSYLFSVFMVDGPSPPPPLFFLS